MINEFVLTSGAACASTTPAASTDRSARSTAPAYDPTQNLPTVVLRNEDYGRITRILADGTPVSSSSTSQNRTYPAGKTSYNAIAEIPGTDKADEVVMLGGHLDSWHSATGATDNAIGCAVMMEAARILQAIGVKPRRTIRVALWGGEEQGLLGSKAYVEQHFGTAENPKPEFAKFNGYFNVDGGTGPHSRRLDLRTARRRRQILGTVLQAVRGSRRLWRDRHDQPRRPAAPTARRSTPPACPASASARTRSNTTATRGTPTSTPIERIVEDDVKKSAVAIASAVYHVAMRDQMLPRFAPDKMPAPPAPAGRGGGAPAASQR